MEKQLRALAIDPEFRDLISPLTDEERELLEVSLLKEGCETPLVIWNGTIMDGHNRYEICQKHSIPFAVLEKEFASREEAQLWIITNQLGRRNLNSYQRGELVQRYKPLVAAQSEQGKRTDLNNLSQNSGRSSNPIGTDKKLAQMAGISHDTLHKVDKLSKAADEETKGKLRRGEMSVNRAYTELMHREHAKETRTCTRCNQEKPVAEFRVPSKHHDFSPICTACEKGIPGVTGQATNDDQQISDTAGQIAESIKSQPISSIGMHRGHLIHVGAPFPDKPEMFTYLEEHVRLITGNFIAGAANATRMYTPGMASPANTRTLREILKSACDAVEAFDEYVEELLSYE